MNENEGEQTYKPLIDTCWLTLDITRDMQWIALGPLRLLLYNPFYRDNWQLDAIVRWGCLQLGLGPIVMGLLWGVE